MIRCLQLLTRLFNKSYPLSRLITGIVVSVVEFKRKGNNKLFTDNSSFSVFSNLIIFKHNSFSFAFSKDDRRNYHCFLIVIHVYSYEKVQIPDMQEAIT